MSTTTITSPSSDDHLARFGSKLSNLAEHITELAHIYCDGLAEDPDFRDKVLQRFPMISAGLLSRLPLAVQGKLYGGMLLIDHATQFQRLPVAIQQAAMDHGIDCLTPTGETRKVFPQTMDMATIRQCIAWDRVRTPEEQRAYMDKQVAKAPQPPTSAIPAAQVIGNKGNRRLKLLRAGAELTRLEVLHLLADMEG